MIPARAQIVLVRNEPGTMMTVSGTDDGEEEVTYIMERAAGMSFHPHVTIAVIDELV